jgi:hypothetical protein
MNRSASLRRRIASLESQIAEAEELLAAQEGHQAHDMFDEYDLNMDGLIEESEWGGSPEVFDALDTNHDMYLDPSEVEMGFGSSFSKLASASKFKGIARRKLAGQGVTALVHEMIEDAVHKIIRVNPVAVSRIKKALYELGTHPTDQNITAMFDLVDVLDIDDNEKSKIKMVIQNAFLKIQEVIQSEYFDKFDDEVPASVQRELDMLGLDLEPGEDFKRELRELEFKDSPDLEKQLKSFHLDLGPSLETKKQISNFSLGRLASRRRKAHSMFDEYDTNMDGLIDSNEWGGSPEAFNSLDTDLDGLLSPNEINMGVGNSFGKSASYRRRASQQRRRPSQQRRRASQDQYLSPEEIADILGGTLISKGRR